MNDTEPLDDRPRDRVVDRRTFLAGGLKVTTAITAASLGVDSLAAAGAAAAPVPKPKPGRSRRSSQPNILVIMVDQLRTPRWFGPGGHAAALPPNIAGLARSGVSFLRHYTASNDCSPARAALLTGLHSHQTGCMITGASTLDPGFPTWGTMLRSQGYATYWYGKWHVTHGDAHWKVSNGPAGLARYGFDGGTFPSPNGAPGQGWKVDPMITEEFDRWYKEAAAAGPWCTTVSFVNPHDIAWWWRWSKVSAVEAASPSRITALPPNFETPEQLAARGKPRVQRSLQDTSAVSFGEVPFSGPNVQAGWLPFLDLYAKLQLEVDRHVGHVLQTLASRPQVMDNTIVVFTSDHGEYGASHGLRGKGAGMYEEGINVPLIVSDRTGTLGAVPNSVRHQLTSSVDVAPMLLTLASGSANWRRDPGYSHIATRADLAQILANPTAPGRRYALHATDEVLTEFALLPYDAAAPLHVKGIITQNAKYATYSHWQTGTTNALSQSEEAELYDYRTRAGYLELENGAGRSRLEDALRASLGQATLEELHAPLPFPLVDARRRGLEEYGRIAGAMRRVSAVHRLKAVEKIVRKIEKGLP